MAPKTNLITDDDIILLLFGNNDIETWTYIVTHLVTILQGYFVLFYTMNLIGSEKMTFLAAMLALVIVKVQCQ